MTKAANRAPSDPTSSEQVPRGAAAGTVQSRQGLYYEDLDVGAAFETGWREVTPQDVQAFCDLTGDHNPLHTDPEFARRTPFGRPIAHGLFGLSILVGLFEEVGVFHGTALALLGIDEWRFLRPIFISDRVRARMTIADKRLSRDPSRGIVKRRYELLNQDDEVVQEGHTTVLLRTRGDEGASRA